MFPGVAVLGNALLKEGCLAVGTRLLGDGTSHAVRVCSDRISKLCLLNPHTVSELSIISDCTSLDFISLGSFRRGAARGR